MEILLTERERELAIQALNTQAQYWIEQSNKPNMPAVVKLAYRKTADEFLATAMIVEMQEPKKLVVKLKTV